MHAPLPGDLAVRVIHGVIDEIAISSGDDFADALDGLPSTDLRIQRESLQGRQDGVAHRQGSGRVASANVLGDGGEIGCVLADTRQQIHAEANLLGFSINGDEASTKYLSLCSVSRDDSG